MKIWALADLHLSISCPEKTMEVFGSQWENYHNRIKINWEKIVAPEDLVLIPGDICWAMKFDQALQDLEWIDQLPGTKVLLKGNHDYWWASSEKMKQALPASIHFIYNSSYNTNNISICGARLWDTPEYHYNDAVEVKKKNDKQNEAKKKQKQQEAAKIFPKELHRLRLSLEQLDPNAEIKIAMTHYPPIGPHLQPSEASSLLEEFGVNLCVFGHIHGVKPGTLPMGEARGVQYFLTSCDYLNCTPLQLPI